MKKICVIIGARPQFIKHAPVELALKKIFNVISIHTGQHYDEKMSDIFFRQLNMDRPSYMLEVGSGAHGRQTGVMLEKIEEVLLSEKPDAVLVYGDTNSTLSGALAASKLHIPVIHIEAGLRSFNKSMPEEVNRILTDHISDFLFAPTDTAVANLLHEGIEKSVYKTGDVMYDTVLLAKKVIGSDVHIQEQVLVTLHRPYNTDNLERLTTILTILNGLKYAIIFPIHPRTKNILKSANIDISIFNNINFIDPVSYFDLIRLQMESKCIITDSGGVQKEAYILKRKCITLRSETEWVETLVNGWNTLVFEDLEKLSILVEEQPGSYVGDVYGDGHAAEEIAMLIDKNLRND